MTCPDFQTSKYGRAGIGVVQPQSGLDYPLVAPSADVRYLLADLHLSYDDDGEYDTAIPPAVHPLRIKYLYGIGCVENTPPVGFPAPAHAADIVIVDANGRVILDTTAGQTTFNSATWSADYRIYEWKTPRAVCRLVVHTTWPDDDNGQTDADTRQNYDKYLAPVTGWLDDRAVYKIPRRLLSLRARNNQSLSPRYSGAFKFGNGYNTEIVAAQPATTIFRTGVAVTFNIAAGTGLGRYGECPDNPPPITKINGVTGTDFYISGNDCLWVRRPVTVGLTAPYAVNPSTTAHQQIGGDCNPCCSCDDYATTAKYMNDTSYRYKLIGQRTEKVREEHENNIVRWLSARACSVQHPLRLFMVPQRCPCIDVVMMLCNPCDTCIEPTRLTLTLSVSGDFVPANSETSVAIRPTIECGYTTMYAPGVSGNAVSIDVANDGFEYSTTLPQLKSNSSAYVQFRIRFSQYDPANPEAADTKARGPYAVTGTLTGAYLTDNQPVLTNCGENLNDGSPPLPASAEVTQTLNCNAEGATEAAC